MELTRQDLLCKHCGYPLVVMAHEDSIESTLVGYEVGACGEKHDDNCVTRVAWCRFGHKTPISIRRTCSACDWRGMASCQSCRTVKLDAWPDLPIGKPAEPLIVHPDAVSLVDRLA